MSWSPQIQSQQDKRQFCGRRGATGEEKERASIDGKRTRRRSAWIKEWTRQCNFVTNLCVCPNIKSATGKLTREPLSYSSWKNDGVSPRLPAAGFCKQFFCKLLQLVQLVHSDGIDVAYTVGSSQPACWKCAVLRPNAKMETDFAGGKELGVVPVIKIHSITTTSPGVKVPGRALKLHDFCFTFSQRCIPGSVMKLWTRIFHSTAVDTAQIFGSGIELNLCKFRHYNTHSWYRLNQIMTSCARLWLFVCAREDEAVELWFWRVCSLLSETVCKLMLQLKDPVDLWFILFPPQLLQPEWNTNDVLCDYGLPVYESKC